MPSTTGLVNSLTALRFTPLSRKSRTARACVANMVVVLVLYFASAAERGPTPRLKQTGQTSESWPGTASVTARSPRDWSPTVRVPPSVGSASRRARTMSGCPSRRCSVQLTTVRSGRSSALWWDGTIVDREWPRRSLEAAIGYARTHGARTLEGYPLHESRGKVASSAAYVGTQAMFERAGFTVAELRSWDSSSPPRPIMRLELS